MSVTTWWETYPGHLMKMFLKFFCSFINLHCIKTVFTTWANYWSSKRNIASLYPMRSTVKKKKKSLFSWFCNPNRKWDEKIFPKCNYFIVNTYCLELEEVNNDTNIVHLATCKCALVSQLMHILTLCLCLSFFALWNTAKSFPGSVNEI